MHRCAPPPHRVARPRAIQAVEAERGLRVPDVSVEPVLRVHVVKRERPVCARKPACGNPYSDTIAHAHTRTSHTCAAAKSASGTHTAGQRTALDNKLRRQQGTSCGTHLPPPSVCAQRVSTDMNTQDITRTLLAHYLLAHCSPLVPHLCHGVCCLAVPDLVQNTGVARGTHSREEAKHQAPSSRTPCHPGPCRTLRAFFRRTAAARRRDRNHRTLRHVIGHGTDIREFIPVFSIFVL